MKYGKLINGQLEIVKSTIETPLGMLNLSKEVMFKKGAKLIIDNPLNYNEETQILEVVGYTELEKEIIIDYMVRDKNPLPTNEERINNLELINDKFSIEQQSQDSFIEVTMLATDEIYMMIEPLLDSIKTMSITDNENLDNKEVNRMVDFYAAMVIKGLKDIDSVPLRYREDVKKLLAELEK